MKVIVIGAGIVGTTSAYFLAKTGHEVHVVDRQPAAALETSFANGGVVHASETEPWSRPGTPRKLFAWMGKTDAPMLVRFGALPSLWRWGLEFLRNCSPERFHAASAVNLRLANHALACLDQIRTDTGVAYQQGRKGSLKIYSDPAALARDAAIAERLKDLGLRFEIADPARCVAIEPALAPIRDTLAGGYYGPNDEHGDCRLFTIALADHCTKALGVTFDFGTTVRVINRSGDAIRNLETSKGRMTADAYVVAAASYAPALVQPLGIRLAIYPAKGISITVPAQAWPDGPETPLLHDTYVFALTRLGDTYRAAGSVEFCGWDTRLNEPRAQMLIANIGRVFPGFDRCYDPATARVWTGLRPLSSAGLAYIGGTPVRNLFLNCGHGQIGWTLASGSSQVLADIVSGRPPAIDTTGFTLATRM